MTRNQLQYWENQEVIRHNLELERQGREQIENAKRLAQIQASQQQETVRSNQARERETKRSNVANEAINVLRTVETSRSNQANEEIGRTQAAAATSQATTAATKVEYEHQDREASQDETSRSNRSNEDIKQNSSPWTSIATTLGKVIPYVAERVTTFVDNLKAQSKPSRSERLAAWNRNEQLYRNAVKLPTKTK